MSKMAKNKVFNNFGQSIIEIVVAIAIGGILIVTLVVLSIRSNRGADISKVENQGAKLASEGVEILKNIKALGGPGIIYYDPTCAGGTGAGSGFFSWAGFFGSPVPGDIPETGSCTSTQFGRKGVLFRDPSHNPNGWDTTNCNETSESWCMNMSNNNNETITIDNRNFTRSVYAADTSPVSKCNSVASDWNQIKQFTVIVSWNDASGLHSSTATTCLTNL